MSGVTQVECIKTCLGFFERNLHFAGLQNLVGVIGREPESHTAVHDVFAQPECQIDNTLFSFFVSDRIIVERTRHARHGRVITVAILVADHFLQDYGHFLLVDDIACGLHISL